MTQQIATQENNNLAAIEKTIIQGDLSGLSPEQRLNYYKQVCDSLRLNWLTKPFEFLELVDKKTGQKRVVLYARKECSEQIRARDKCSGEIIKTEVIGDVFCVWTRTLTPDGRYTDQLGGVSIKGLSAEDRANAMKKAITQSYRRGILAHAGLGYLDETEIETIPDARTLETNLENGK